MNNYTYDYEDDPDYAMSDAKVVNIYCSRYNLCSSEEANELKEWINKTARVKYGFSIRESVGEIVGQMVFARAQELNLLEPLEGDWSSPKAEELVIKSVMLQLLSEFHAEKILKHGGKEAGFNVNI